MLLIKYVGHIDLMSLTDGHLGRHLEYFKTLNDARVASLGFFKFNAHTKRINKEKNFKIKFLVILVFYRTIWHNIGSINDQFGWSYITKFAVCLSKMTKCPASSSYNGFIIAKIAIFINKLSFFSVPEKYLDCSTTKSTCSS